MKFYKIREISKDKYKEPVYGITLPKEAEENFKNKLVTFEIKKDCLIIRPSGLT